MSLLCRWTSGFVHFWDKVVDTPVVSTTVLLFTVKVPQIQFIAGISGHSCCTTETGAMLPVVAVMAAMMVFYAF